MTNYLANRYYGCLPCSVLAVVLVVFGCCKGGACTSLDRSGVEVLVCCRYSLKSNHADVGAFSACFLHVFASQPRAAEVRFFPAPSPWPI